VPWRFSDAGRRACRGLLTAGVRKPAQIQTHASQQTNPYSITSSARASSVGGTSREVELGRLLDRKIGGLRPSQNLVDQVAGAPLKSMKATVPTGVENSYFS
jgi:hypothetical protein